LGTVSRQTEVTFELVPRMTDSDKHTEKFCKSINYMGIKQQTILAFLD
jgi:hypothetical protein